MIRMLHKLGKGLQRIVDERRGNVAIVFALSVMPVMMAAGAAIDFSRMSVSRSHLQNATDTVALTIAKDIERGKNQGQIVTDINSILTAEMKTAGLSNWTVSYSYNGDSGVVSANTTATLPSMMLNLVNVKSLKVAAQSTATFGTDYVELALVLDNTGSMLNLSKMTSLKTAATSMVDKIAATQAGKEGRASVSVVPFTVTVNVDTANDNAAWLGARGTYQTCGWQWVSSGWWGSYQWVCTSYTKTWTGCVGDRESPYTSTSTTATSSNSATLYPRAYDTNDCVGSTILPLTTNFTDAKAKITAMVAGGNTNVAIGAMWGWNMLRPGAPLSNAGTATTTKKISRYAIILTDGANTENTLGHTTSQIDTNTLDTCTAMKSAGITVFSIRVVDGNETLLKNCASSSDYYYNVSDPSTLTSVFDRILTNITKLRLSS